MEHGAQVIWKIVPLKPTNHLYCKVIVTSLGAIADLRNTQRQNGQRKMFQANEQEKSPEKE